MYRIKSFRNIALPDKNIADPYDAIAPFKPSFTDHRLATFDAIRDGIDIQSGEPLPFSAEDIDYPHTLQSRVMAVTGSSVADTLNEADTIFRQLRANINQVGALVRERVDGSGDKHTIRARLLSVTGNYTSFNNRFIENFTCNFELMRPTWYGLRKMVTVNPPTNVAAVINNDGDGFLTDFFIRCAHGFIQAGAAREIRVENNTPVGPQLRRHKWIMSNDEQNAQAGQFLYLDTISRAWRVGGNFLGIEGRDATDSILTIDDDHNQQDLMVVPPGKTFVFKVELSGSWILPADVDIFYYDAWL